MNRRIRDRLMTAEEAAKWIHKDTWVVSAGFYNSDFESEVIQALRQTSHEDSSWGLQNRLDLHWQSGWKCPDVAILNASALFSEGFVPTTSVGNSALLAQAAREIIIEWNVNWPGTIIGLHDIYEDACISKVVQVPFKRLTERFGSTYVPLDWTKVIAVVKVNRPLDFSGNSPVSGSFPSTGAPQMIDHLLDFLENERLQGRFNKVLPPLQTSLGNEAAAFFNGLREADWKPLSFFSDVLDSGVIPLIQNGQVYEATASTLNLHSDNSRHLHSLFRDLEERLVLRPIGVITASDVLPRLGFVAINTVRELDIYGNAKLEKSALNARSMTQDFARHARLSIVLAPSLHPQPGSPQVLNSTVISQVAQPDLSTREVDVVISEHGVADLRGLAPEERAKQIVHCCANPSHRETLAHLL